MIRILLREGGTLAIARKGFIEERFFTVKNLNEPTPDATLLILGYAPGSTVSPAFGDTKGAAQFLVRDAADGAFETFWLFRLGGNPPFSFGSPDPSRVILPDAEGLYLQGTSANETWDFSAMTGTLQVASGAGFDQVIGGSGRDSLNGGAGSDVLDGGMGNDRLTGGTGSDRLIGGEGADTYFFAKGDFEMDVIIGFEGAGRPGGDMLRFSGFGAGSTLSFVEIDANGAQIWSVYDPTDQSEHLFAVRGAVGTIGAGDYAFG